MGRKEKKPEIINRERALRILYEKVPKLKPWFNINPAYQEMENNDLLEGINEIVILEIEDIKNGKLDSNGGE